MNIIFFEKIAKLIFFFYNQDFIKMKFIIFRVYIIS